MRKSIKIAPSNSLVFVSDSAGGTIPQITRGPWLWATSSCIAVGCYPEKDGDTEVVLGKMQEIAPGDNLAFDGELETPNHAVIVSTVEGNTILEMAVSGSRTHVRIWVSHPRWPDKVIIGLE